MKPFARVRKLPKKFLKLTAGLARTMELVEVPDGAIVSDMNLEYRISREKTLQLWSFLERHAVPTSLQNIFVLEIHRACYKQGRATLNICYVTHRDERPKLTDCNICMYRPRLVLNFIFPRSCKQKLKSADFNAYYNVGPTSSSPESRMRYKNSYLSISFKRDRK